MTIENTEVVDSAGIDKVTGEVVLTISDHLSWEDTETHCRLIEAKINRYLNFVDSGQVLESFPQARQAPIRIRLVCQYPPSDSVSAFLAAVQRQLRELGIAFTHGTLPPGH